MKYLLMIYENEKAWESKSKEESEQLLGEYFAYTDSVQKSGNLIAGEALQPTQTATTVRVRDGKRLTTDGPFAETREQLGGFYLVEAKDLDEAIALASRIPSARLGCIEIRPVWELSESAG
ncbi:YciI family protein [Myxococcus sp. CA051A]|uniref:YciI family protein n=1 Tax=unclassified Myxococcus TaxID=2648731 RepID=UPI00157B2053|nr:MULTISPECIES: YciI family protein [unclassified Myxococcus]NTX16855.1 YciI family protein [Myxococcus sp. CA056]NTX41568.1 YciI family protein [Myxococcus sp. CA033]NTX52033.1 YciI family protein [Myxococcus sp. CA039A]NTX66896.1 YciI family protein [Myxococcus sp. CA051A]